MKNSYLVDIDIHTKLVDKRLEDRFVTILDNFIDNFGKRVSLKGLSKTEDC
jgi:hypothetical protein